MAINKFEILAKRVCKESGQKVAKKLIFFKKNSTFTFIHYNLGVLSSAILLAAEICKNKCTIVRTRQVFGKSWHFKVIKTLPPFIFRNFILPFNF